MVEFVLHCIRVVEFLACACVLEFVMLLHFVSVYNALVVIVQIKN